MPSDQGRNYERERQLIEASNLDAKIRMLINRWAPEDGPRDFEADLIQIVQYIYREAQAPFLAAVSAAVSAQPMPPVILSNQKP